MLKSLLPRLLRMLAKFLCGCRVEGQRLSDRGQRLSESLEVTVIS